MLKMTKDEVRILNALKGATPSVAAFRLGIKEQKVYNTIHYFRRKTQNAQDFLAVAKGEYGFVLNRRLATPKIKPCKEDDEPLLCESHDEEES